MNADRMSEYEMRDFAKFYIKRYFSEIPEEVVLDSKYVDLCLRTDISSGMKRAYDSMKNSGRFKDDPDVVHPIEKDVKYVIKTLGLMSKKVPQELSAGMLLMHLEIIEGIELTA